MEDREIVGLYWARAEEAITESEKKYGTYCHAIAYRILGSHQDAEEQVSDTWLRAWDAMPPERPAHLGAFFGTLTRNLSINRWRALRTEKRGGGQTALALEELEECIPAGESAESAVLAGELAAELEQFLKTLPEREKCVFVARYWGLYSAREIGERYGYGAGTVRSMLHRTRKKLQQYLSERGYGL